jgi:unsaturated chondroitin disaccharide hydrolase
MSRMPKALASLTATIAMALLAGVPSAALAAPPLERIVRHDLHFARAQLKRTLAEVPVDAYPQQTGTDGTWSTSRARAWTSGFLAGSLWLMFQATGDPAWRSAAEARQAGLESQKTRTSTHDLGFMLFDSFGRGYELTGLDRYRQVVLTAARSLATRYSRAVHAIRSVNNPPHAGGSGFGVVVDGLMNLELLSWAAAHGDDPALAKLAFEHALTTARSHVRSDGSTYQLVFFDSETGAVKRRGTAQGYSDSSTWSRGQAWALYGFTAAYRDSHDSRLLASARKVAHYFVSQLPADKVPPWDFQAPRTPEPPRDSSAAAIAASGLLELARIEPNADRAHGDLTTARAILRSLSSRAYLAEGTGKRSILLRGTSDYRRAQYDRGLVYGDYFFLEALLRYRAMHS